MKTRNKNIQGFSLYEVIAVVAIIGIIAGMTFPMIADIRTTVTEDTLESDTKSINRAIEAYVVSGGDLGGVTDPQAVLDKVKSAQAVGMEKSTVGFSGTLLDKRLAVKLIGNTTTEPDTIDENNNGSNGNQKGHEHGKGNHKGHEHGKGHQKGHNDNSDSVVSASLMLPDDPEISRAIWHASEKKFKIAKSGVGVAEFFYDEALAEHDYGNEQRDAAGFQYNNEDGWIWDGVEAMPASLPGTTGISTGDPTDTSNPAPIQLNPPIFTPVGGMFPHTASPLSVSLLNPNGGSTNIKYQVVGTGTWLDYTGPLTLTNDTRIVAYVDGDPASWIRSANRSAEWRFENQDINRLQAPIITLSSSVFDNDNLTIDYTLTNPNPAGSSQVYFVIRDIAEVIPDRTVWSLYGSSGTVDHTTYPQGFRIKAYAKSIDLSNYRDSVNAEETTTEGFFGVPTTGDVLFVLDGSGSMGATFGSSGLTRFQRVVQETVSAIQGLAEDQHFNVVVFDDGLHWADGSWTMHDATQSNKDTIIASLNALTDDGGTNYSVGLSLVLAFDIQPSNVLFLSDGDPNDLNYYGDISAIQAASSANPNVDTVVNTIGFDATAGAQARLQEIASLLNGSYTQIDP